MNSVAMFAREIRSVNRILPPKEFKRWLRVLWQNLGTVMARKSLGCVDEAFGEHFSVNIYKRILHFENTSFGVVREIIGRECYIKAYDMAKCNKVLDLGANAGVFSIYALATATRCTVRAVEAQPEFIPIIHNNSKLNGFEDRVEVENSLVGGAHDDWSRSLQRRCPYVVTFPVAQRLEEMGDCDFMKCDIEGAEFHLLLNQPHWLRRVRRLALEYHGIWQAGAELAKVIRESGFHVTQAKHGTLGYIFATRI